MINYSDALFAFVVVLHLCGAVAWWVLWREIVGVREDARARDKTLGKLLAPVVRPPARPVRGFLGHRTPTGPPDPPIDPEGTGRLEDPGVAVIVYWPGRGEDAERTVREVAS